MKAYFESNGIAIYHGNCLDILPCLGHFDVAIADPPYGATSLKWDKRVQHWPDMIQSNVLWCFGSFRFFLQCVDVFSSWKLGQDLIWKKHNGSSFHADRFRRIHEHVVQFYRGSWKQIFKNPQYTLDAQKRITAVGKKKEERFCEAAARRLEEECEKDG